MFLRKLTDEELEKIKKAKDAANVIIKMQRRGLIAKIKINQKAFRIHQVEILTKDLDALKVVIGHPVIIKVDDQAIHLDYDLLKKFEHSLDKYNQWTDYPKIEGESLVLRYGGHHANRGTVELFELPAYQVGLLEGLPIIDLKE
ncbi:MAG TPA: hypothetical protein VFC84_02060 [Desulfosporosinus sp.]|nr:hypothetical protein [Desulfosporosinus sp.]